LPIYIFLVADQVALALPAHPPVRVKFAVPSDVVGEEKVPLNVYDM
jgi:hypothetical protein